MLRNCLSFIFRNKCDVITYLFVLRNECYVIVSNQNKPLAAVASITLEKFIQMHLRNSKKHFFLLNMKPQNIFGVLKILETL